MAELKNILEDIVWHRIEEMEESKKGILSPLQKVEMAAYVLNRMRPLYTTSSRGFVYMIQKYENDPQFLADIWVLLSQAVKIVQRSKDTEVGSPSLQEGKLYYFFPRIYGRVLEGKTMAPIEDGEVSLWQGESLVPSYYAKWYNPYHIKPDEGGWYAFAPFPEEAHEKKSREFTFIIQVNTFSKRHLYSFSLEVQPREWRMGEEVFGEVFEVPDIYI
ncbi:MAG: late competence development ComFB family protein [Brevinematales bacterium]|nr:late competence development ComFB family protein [Brevinematales bacterium]